MRIATAEREMETSGLGETRGFGMETSPVAFEVLSDSLYEDKPWAIVRELSANCQDAAGDDWELTLPTRLSLTLVFKDYGTGLKHEDVMHLYTTYFASTKRQDNKSIGGFGLGSKTPFAYTDTFSVESRHNGEKRIYTAFKNEDGEPQISLLHTEESDERSGLTIKIPVKYEDMGRFYDAARRTLKWYDVKPTMKGEKIDVPEIGVRLESPNKDWYFYQCETNMNGLHVQMGAVGYKVSWSALESLDQKLREFAYSPIVIRANIGDCAVAASREGLSYKPITMRFLEDKLRQIVDQDLQEMYSDLFVDCESVWEATGKMSEFIGSMPYEMRDALDSKFKFQGRPINSHFRLQSPGEDFSIITLNSWYNRLDWRSGMSVDPREIDVVLIDDIRNLPRKFDRVRHHLEENGLSKALLLRGDTEDYIEKLGNPPALNLSETEMPPKAATTVSGSGYASTPLTVMEDDTNNIHPRWSSASIQSDQGGLYLIHCRNEIEVPEKHRGKVPSHMYREIRNLPGIKGEKVYSFNATYRNEPGKHGDKWKNVWDAAYEAVKAFSTNPENKRKVTEANAFDEFRHKDIIRFLQELEAREIDIAKPLSPLGRLQRAYRKHHESYSITQEDQALFSLLKCWDGLEMKTLKPKTDWQALLDGVDSMQLKIIERMGYYMLRDEEDYRAFLNVLV